MLIWLEGRLNPNEIKKKLMDEHESDFQQRLLAYLDDTISTSIPDPAPDTNNDPAQPHPCSIRGVDPDLTGIALANAKMNDCHRLAKSCQQHNHTQTCYKYWKGAPAPKECRFDLDENNQRLHTTVDPDTGKICLQCLDGLVNNVNSTILEAI